MEQFTYFLLALIPFVLIFALMVWLRIAAVKAMPVVFIVTLFITFFMWGVSLSVISASFVKGLFVVIEILLIVFFAILLLLILKNSGRMLTIEQFLSSISGDARVLGILIAWGFVSLIEGASGFGTPAALAAPLLVYMGFTPIGAVIISLIGDSTAVTFGAGGTPIIIGLGTLGFGQEILDYTIIYSALIHSLLSIIVPLAIGYYVSRMYKAKSFREIIPFCIVGWAAFTIPYFIIAVFVGPEIPSIAGGLISLLVMGYFAKKKILVPKKEIRLNKRFVTKKMNTRKIIGALSPYIFLVFLLIVTRTIPALGDLMHDVKLSIPSVLGVQINYVLYPLWTPSFYFMLTCLFALLVFRVKWKCIYDVCEDDFRKITTPAIALVFSLGVVQLFLFSSSNALGLPSMPVMLARFIGDFFQHFFLIFSPLIGTLGAFVTGSNTVSNLLFGSFQAETAISLGLSAAGALALQTVGGAVGNMIAIHNVLAASATVGLKHEEGNIIRKTIKPALIYTLLAGILGFILFGLMRLS